MKRKFTLSILTLISTFFYLTAQDTITVQAFNYDSETRNMLVEFPEGNHNDYEKIIMLYSMRCKDGLISTGADRNKGCGEWDYSCNTYVVDSSQVDSLRATAPTHRISGFTGSTFKYTTQPTYSYYQTTQKSVTYNSVISENEYTIGSGNTAVSFPFGGNQTILRSQLLYTADALTGEGMQAGDITGLKINVQSPAMGFDKLRIRMKSTSRQNLEGAAMDDAGLQEVYYLDTDMVSAAQFLKFHSPFTWNGTANILVDISYVRTGAGAMSTVQSSPQSGVSSLYANATSDYVLEFQGAGRVLVDQPLESISNEVTISLWQYGDRVMPINSSILEGSDENNQRQVNVHLPWSNGEVYWDCGNDGSGYDRINKPANAGDYKGGWNHWAFTKNAVSGEMKIYLNGTLWHSGTDKFKSIDIQQLSIGAAVNFNNPYFGKIDEFTIWDKELSQADIKEWMTKEITAAHPQYSHLVAYYHFDDLGSTTVTDASPNSTNAKTEGPLAYRQWQGRNLVKNIAESTDLPNMTFVQGVYNQSVMETIVLDSLINVANQVDAYIVVGTDLVLNSSNYYYASGNMPIYDDLGNIIGNVVIPEEAVINIGQLQYVQKNPAKYELLSFVTPYGIGLNFGIGGKTWTFDVTDFGPILKGKKRITMERGGEWQEDIDIKFLFVKGTPTRNVLAITQVWPASSEPNSRILSDERFEPRAIPTPSNASLFKLKAAITGHGQEGEFIPRFHFLTVNNFDVLEWRVWKECADNPVYPQGGTWIYDRAGWCPGAPTDVQEIDVTDVVTPGEPATVDYSMEQASGDSRYIVNVQLVSYGSPNFNLDAELVDIINPSTKIEYGRFNPMCGNPRILIRNNGTTKLTSLNISYQVDTDTPISYNWEGSLDYLETEEVVLPSLGRALKNSPRDFHVQISSPNAGVDENENNNSLSTLFKGVPIFASDIIIRMKTNNAGSETSYTLKDLDGNLIFRRNGNLGVNKTYTDTLKNLSGCYQLLVQDTDDDGISFWANQDGDGYVRIKNADAISYKDVATDFGKFVSYDFYADGPTPTNDLTDEKYLNIYPNPGHAVFSVDMEGFEGEVTLELINSIGQVVQQQIVGNLHRDFISHQLDLSAQNAGIYYLKISENGNAEVRKLVKLD